MKRPEPSSLTVYSAIAKDGTLRWSLHKMDNAPPMHQSAYTKPKNRWPFRVVFNELQDDLIRKSCRGNTNFGFFPWTLMGIPLFNSEIEFMAMNWLYAGYKGED